MKKLFDSFNKKTLVPDINSGIVVFLVALPLCLGIALASEAPMMSGILAGIVGGIVVGLIGGSSLGVSGPAAGLVAVIIAAQVTLGSFEAVLLATVIAGIIQVLLGVVRAGVIAYYFPTAVIKGMLAAIGLIIFLKQIPHALGDDLDYEGDLDFFQKDGLNTFAEIGKAFSALEIEPMSVIIVILGLAMLILWERPFLKKYRFFQLVPGPLAVVITGALAQVGLGKLQPAWALSKDHLVNIPSFSSPLEWITLPNFGEIGNPQVWVVAITIAAVASVESLLCAEATDKLDPDRRITPMSKELRAQGIANMITGMIGGLPITQVIVRSSANVQAGGRTRMAAIFHGLLILIAVMAFPFLLNKIPLAALAAVLMVVGYKLAQPSLFKKMYQYGPSQFIPFLVTIVAILFTDLLVGIGIGMGVGILFVLHRNFRIPYTYKVEMQNERPEITISLSEIVSFLNKGNIISTLRLVPDGAHVIIDATRSMHIDPDVIDALDDFKENASHRDITIVMRNVSATVAQSMPSPAKALIKELEAVQTELKKNSNGGKNDRKPADMEKA